MMNIKKYIYGAALGSLSLAFASCYNADKEFPDYEDGTTAYFAYQYPVRTLVLGNDIYDNTLDNEHKCRIWATMGGAYGGRNATLQIAVADSLCNNLYFTDDGGNAAAHVTPLPKTHYKLLSDQIPYNGDSRGYVEVQFTDDFFNDTLSVENNYVIPLLITGANGFDHILTGEPLAGYKPARVNTMYWKTLAKDYVLYCVKYMNPWQGKYIRRGVDQVTQNGTTTTVVRKDMSLINTDINRYHENPVNQNDEVCGITTKNMKQSVFPTSFKVPGGASVACNLVLTFDGDKCTITTNDADASATGSGEFITKGTERPEYKDYQWGSMNGEPVQRDILRLAYNVSFKKGKVIGKDKNYKEILLQNDVDVVTADTLVVQTREANQKVFFTPKYEIK